MFTIYIADSSESRQFFVQKEDRIGGKYKKALYIEYTDDTFNTPKNRTEPELHLGSLGPVIRGEVGDTIEVVFRNKVSLTPAPKEVSCSLLIKRLKKSTVLLEMHWHKQQTT